LVDEGVEARGDAMGEEVYEDIDADEDDIVQRSV
jgi:hypothetical protein